MNIKDKRKLEKLWVVKAKIDKGTVVSMVLTHEPTVEDIQNFVDRMDYFIGDVTVEVIWTVS